MKFLCLSTAEQGCSLAIVDGKSPVCEEYWEVKKTHSTRLLTMIEHMLEKRACINLSDIDAFVAAKGPGSFTGLRIGISVIKGLAYASEKKSLGVSSLDGVAFRFVHSQLPVCVMMDARRNQVYCAVYVFEHGSLISKTSERVVSPQEAVNMTQGPSLFAGSGSKAYKGIIEKSADQPIIGHESFDSVNAAALILSLSSNHDYLNNPDNILNPSYIRKSDAQLQFGK